MQSTLVQVSPGDIILGTITAADCDSDGVCKTWTVTTLDETTGKSTVLHTNAGGKAMDEINPMVLETYGVTSCEMFPANGEIVAYDNYIKDASGNSVSPDYTLNNCASEDCGSGSKLPSSFPTDCGFGGSSSGGRYTLKFGKSPTPAPSPSGGTDAGTSSDTDASTGDVDSGSGDESGGTTSGNTPSAPTTTGSVDSGAGGATTTGDGDGGTSDSDNGDSSTSSGGCSSSPRSNRGHGLAFLGLASLISMLVLRRRSKK